ncbi:MAG: hypothetical protein JOS17DRAFT_739063 [Linnemannia elongata]|nr:MAG: hypothetical protein JOS17DRAFT_739063 [Linnemannia elongata]
MTLLSSTLFVFLPSNARSLSHFLFNHVTIQKPVQFQGIVHFFSSPLLSFLSSFFPASNCSGPAVNLSLRTTSCSFPFGRGSRCG